MHQRALLGLLFFGLLFGQSCQKLSDSSNNSENDSNRTVAANSNTRKVDQYIKTYHRLTKHDDSIALGYPYIKKAFDISTEIGYFKGIAQSAYGLAQINAYFGKNSESVQYNFIALKYAEKIGDHFITGRCFQSVGLFYFSQKKWEKARYNFDMCIKENSAVHDSEANITPTYLRTLCQLELGEIATAKRWLHKLKQYAIEKKDSTLLIQSEIYLGRAAFFEKQYDTALHKYLLSTEFLRHHKEWLGLAQVNAFITSIYLQTGDILKAKDYIDEAYTISKTVPKNFIRMDVTRLIAEVYDKLNNTDKAFDYLKENLEFKDSLFVNDVSSQVALARSNFEFEKKEAAYELELRENERKRKVYTLIAAILAAFVIVVLFAYRGIKAARKESENLLLNILPSQTAQELKKYGKAIPKKHPNATIMFCDVESFTKISEKMSPETLVNMLDDYFSGFDDIIEKYAVEKIKTIGDAYMCASGIRNDQPNHASIMVMAATDIIAFLNATAEDMDRKYGQNLRFRIGIHSGEVVSGVVGKKKYAYDIWGDTVNVAARMEQNSQPGEINITEHTLELIGDLYPVEPRGKIDAKNKGLLEMYFVKPPIEN